VKKRVISLILCVLLFFSLSVTAFADMGPKPSVRVTFTGVGDEIYYGTLLSDRRSTGPSSAWDGKAPYPDYRWRENQKEIWEKFIAYEDPDGFYFLQEWWECSENDQLNWTYYPPSTYKILLYFPESDCFCVSPIYERYAYDSYYTVDLSDSESGEIFAQRSYNYGIEIVSLIARIVLTLALELLIALLFGYRQKRLFLFLTAVNVITQIALNVALNIINYNMGSMAFTVFYVLLEIAVFIVEAVIFVKGVRRFGDPEQSRGKAVGYAFIANAASFAFGLWLAHIIPGIF